MPADVLSADTFVKVSPENTSVTVTVQGEIITCTQKTVPFRTSAEVRRTSHVSGHMSNPLFKEDIQGT